MSRYRLPCWAVIDRRRQLTATMSATIRCPKGGAMRFTGKVALITAVASGIGRATADIMTREGAVVVGVDNNAERLEKTVAEIAAACGRAHGRLCNALDREQVDPLVADVAKEFGG